MLRFSPHTTSCESYVRRPIVLHGWIFQFQGRTPWCYPVARVLQITPRGWGGKFHCGDFSVCSRICCHTGVETAFEVSEMSLDRTPSSRDHQSQRLPRSSGCFRLLVTSSMGERDAQQIASRRMQVAGVVLRPCVMAVARQQ